MTSSADIYGIIPKKEGGYVLAKTNYVDGVERVSTEDIRRMMRKDPSLHFVSFAFEEIDMMHDYFKEDGSLGSRIGKHLVPVAIFGSFKSGKHVSLMLDCADFKKFEGCFTTRGAVFEEYLCMEGVKTMGQDNAEPWHTKLEKVS